MLTSFRPCTQAEIRRIIMVSPVKSCTLDPIPAFVVREYVDIRFQSTYRKNHSTETAMLRVWSDISY